MQRACCRGPGRQWEPGHQGAHMAQPLQFVVFYVYLGYFTDTGWQSAVDVIAGIQVPLNHFFAVQLSKIVGTVCVKIREPFEDHTLVFTPSSCCSPLLCSSPFPGRRAISGSRMQALSTRGTCWTSGTLPRQRGATASHTKPAPWVTCGPRL